MVAETASETMNCNVALTICSNAPLSSAQQDMWNGQLFDNLRKPKGSGLEGCAKPEGNNNDVVMV